jgi:hypothetical protein
VLLEHCFRFFGQALYDYDSLDTEILCYPKQLVNTGGDVCLLRQCFAVTPERISTVAPRTHALQCLAITVYGGHRLVKRQQTSAFAGHPAPYPLILRYIYDLDGTYDMMDMDDDDGHVHILFFHVFRTVMAATRRHGSRGNFQSICTDSSRDMYSTRCRFAPRRLGSLDDPQHQRMHVWSDLKVHCIADRNPR